MQTEEGRTLAGDRSREMWTLSMGNTKKILSFGPRQHGLLFIEIGA
jgi:hypothetical protein